MNHPIISIIMPSFNQAKYLEEAICSILDQNYPNLEFMIFDGGSTDGSREIIQRYSANLAYCQSRPDNGQTDALIQGFERATGDLIGWINSDDVLLPGTLDLIAEAYMRDSGIELFFGNFILMDDHGRIIKCARIPRKGVRFFGQRGVWVFNQPGTFCSRRVYDLVGGLHPDLNYVMDADLYIRILLQGTRYSHVGTFVAGIRKHALAKTVQMLDKSMAEHFRAAQAYWPPGAAQGKHQRRWRYIYWALQLLNGNLKMVFETMGAQGRPWREWAKSGV